MQFSFEKFIKHQKNPKDRAKLNLVVKIATAIKKNGGRAFIVGGMVRDLVRNKFKGAEIPKDLDLEVYGLQPEKLKSLLSKFGTVNVFGESFSVFKLKDLDIAIPRRDSKTGPGHRGFLVSGDPNLSAKEAVQRRDFTMNALLYDPLNGEIVDEVDGIKDIKAKTLRAVNLKFFGEDPLRVLRAVQFAGRFGLEADKKTLDACKALVKKGELEELSKDRVREEWMKLFLKAPTPSKGLSLAKEMGVFKKHLPVLEKTAKTHQEPEWHPEGDVFVHTCEVLDTAAKIIRRGNLDKQQSLTLMMAALCHDIGKVSTTKVREVRGQNRITSHGHEEAGKKLVKEVLNFFEMPKEIVRKVENLVGDHMFVFHSRKQQPSDAGVRRLIVRLYPATLQELGWLVEADYPSRQNKAAIRKLLSHAQKLDRSSVKSGKLKPLVKGRDLLKWGFEPGPKMGKILKEVLDAQVEGKVKTLSEAKKFIENNY